MFPLYHNTPHLCFLQTSWTIQLSVCAWRELNYRFSENILFPNIDSSGCMFVFLLRQLTDHSSLHFTSGILENMQNIHSVLKLSNLQLGSGRAVQVETSVVECVSRSCQLRNENDVLRSTLCTVSDEICLCSGGFIPVLVSHDGEKQREQKERSSWKLKFRHFNVTFCSFGCEFEE